VAADKFGSQSRQFGYVLLLGLTALALLGVALVAIPGSPWHEMTKLGLDLRGGVEVVLRAQPPNGRRPTFSEMDQAIAIVRDRVDRLGVAEHDVRKQGSDEIVAQIAGVRDPAAAARLIGRTGQLELFDVEPNLLAGPEGTLFALLKQVQSAAGARQASRWYLFDPSHRLAAGPQPTLRALLASVRVKGLLDDSGRLPNGYSVLPAPDRSVVFTCGPGDLCPRRSREEEGTALYLFRRDPERGIPELVGRDLRSAEVDYDPEAPYAFTVELTPDGARKLHELTALQARRGRALGENQHTAVVLDREIRSVLTLDYEKVPQGVSGTRIGIRGRNAETVGTISTLLHSGSFPVPFRQVARVEVSSTLGHDSLERAKQAAVVGLVLVALLLIALYRFLGVLAVVGLCVYAAFLYALIARYHVTLTLPAIAGVVLTIALAADANVVIFERIREELRRGRRFRAAMGYGYSRGFRTIVDAHVVTAITAFVVFLAAATRVRGFAVMLLFGTVLSLVTAVVVTRAMLGLVAGSGSDADARWIGARRRRGLEIDFLRRRHLWFGLSVAILVVCAASLATRGLNLGIDFRGGSQVTFETPQRHPIGEVRQVVGDAIGRREAVVQGRDSGVAGTYSSWQLRTRFLSAADSEALQRRLREQLGARELGATTVSASFGRQLAWRALWAVLGALVLVALYIRWRFGPKFALPVIVALVHDLVITLGVYSLSGREVNSATLAAVLTVLGYSIYDTIIIFDRIRENMRLLPQETFTEIANVSLRQTIRRSLTTTVVTLLPVAALFAFGEPTLADFAFAILVGILAGAYSSIFIATPLLATRRERELARRAASATAVAPGAPTAAAEPTATGKVKQQT
jgi:SecD/SecF fusion protein